MFKFKRSFREQIGVNDLVRQPPLKAVKFSSPIKTDQAPKVAEVAPEPMPCPEPTHDDKVELQTSSDIIEKEISEIQKEIEITNEQLLQQKYGRLFLESLSDIVQQSQTMIRDALNAINEQSSAISQKVVPLFEKKKKEHALKFEAFSLKWTDQMLSCEDRIERKKKQLEHEIELHERTLRTIEDRDRKLDEGPNEAPEEIGKVDGVIDSKVDLEPDQSSNNQEGPRTEDDDCVILDNENDITESQNKGTVGKISSNSESTATAADYDEDQTDIDEPKEAPSQRPFTPCQAQRPMS